MTSLPTLWIKRDSITGLLLTGEQEDVMNKVIDAFPMTIQVIFKGQGNPTLEVPLSGQLMSQMEVSDIGYGSNLGQAIINGHILHFDKTNLKLGIEKIGSEGCDKSYFKTSSASDSVQTIEAPSNNTTDDSAAVVSSVLSVGIMTAAVVVAIFLF